MPDAVGDARLLRAALDLVGECAAAPDPARFATTVIRGLHRVLDVDEAVYAEFCPVTGWVGPAFGYPTPPSDALGPSTFWRTHALDHPMARHHLRHGACGPVRLSELMPRRELVRTRYWAEFYRPRGLDQADYLLMPGPGRRVAALSLGRQRHGFTDREHEVFGMLGRPIGAMAAVLRERERLARLSAAGPRRMAGHAALAVTPAERRVVELVVAGLTNRAIADTLHVSVKAVEQHLTHVYRRLSVTSRTQLVARVTD